MASRNHLLLCLLGMMASLAYTAIAQERSSAKSEADTAAKEQKQANAVVSAAAHTSSAGKAASTAQERALRLEGEKRFRTNCGRCHQVPHKFPPRVMAAAIRHMRVRAMITDEDMRLILRYMTQ